MKIVKDPKTGGITDGTCLLDIDCNIFMILISNLNWFKND